MAVGRLQTQRGQVGPGTSYTLVLTHGVDTPLPQPPTTPAYSFPIDITGQSVGSVGAAAAALLVAAEAHRSAGMASQSVAAELERLVDGLAEGVRGGEEGKGV